MQVDEEWIFIYCDRAIMTGVGPVNLGPVKIPPKESFPSHQVMDNYFASTHRIWSRPVYTQKKMENDRTGHLDSAIIFNS